MNLKQMKCPNCGGMLYFEEGLDIFCCKYCATRFTLEDQSEAAYKAKIKIKEFQHDEINQKAKYEFEEKKLEHESERKRSSRQFLFAVLFLILSTFTFIFVITKLGGNMQSNELDKMSDEVRLEIERNDYDSALLLADSIRYTKAMTPNQKSERNTTRENLIAMVRDARLKDPDYITNLAILNTDASAYKGRNYNDAKTELENLGFNNVTIEELEEKAGLFKRTDMVHHITINTIDDFHENDIFNRDAEVIIFIYKQ